MLELNLQLFAADNIAISNDNYANYFNAGSIDSTNMVTTGNVGTPYKDASGNAITGELAGLSTEMKRYYSQYLIKDVGPNIVHAQFLESESLPEGHGETIEWRKWSNFSKKTEPLTEGVTPEPSRITANHKHVRLYEYGDWSLLTNRVQLMTIDRTLVEITEKHAENAKLTLDTITREAMIAGCTNMAFAGNAKVLQQVSAALQPKDAARLTAYLRQNNAPTFDGSYVMIIHPFIAYDLMTNSDWIDVVKYSDSTKIFKGELGKLYGIRFVESTESKVTKATKIASGTASTNTPTKMVLSGYDSTNSKLEFASNTFTADDVTALTATGAPALFLSHTSGGTTSVGRITVATSGFDATNQKITVSSVTDVVSGATITPAAGDIVYADGALNGVDYFTCLVLGKGAGRRVAIGSENARMIIKPKGSSGSEDPMEQRGSVAWHVDAYAAAITNEAYIYKYYCVSSLDGAKAND